MSNINDWKEKRKNISFAKYWKYGCAVTNNQDFKGEGTFAEVRLTGMIPLDISIIEPRKMAYTRMFYISNFTVSDLN